MLARHGKEVEELLLDQYGNSSKSVPKTLLFDHITPATRLLEKRRQMFEVQEALNAQKDEFSRREDAFRRREDALRRKDLELQESLIKFNKFLQENELKRNRALKRVADERKQREIKEIEIKKLEQTLLNKIEEENNLKLELEKNMKYQDYLETIVQNISKYFPEIVDILNRHKILKDANKSLIMKQTNEEIEQDKLNREYISYKKSKENQILNANNEVAELQVVLEGLKSKSSRLQQEVDQRIHEQTQKSLFIGQIISSVSNLLQRCEENFRRRHNKPMIDHVSDKAQDNVSVIAQSERTLSNLDWIALYINDFKDIRNDYVNEYGPILLSPTRPTAGGPNTSNRGSVILTVPHGSNNNSNGGLTSGPNTAPNSHFSASENFPLTHQKSGVNVTSHDHKT